MEQGSKEAENDGSGGDSSLSKQGVSVTAKAVADAIGRVAMTHYQLGSAVTARLGGLPLSLDESKVKEEADASIVALGDAILAHVRTVRR
jgi:hypothetical protein